MQLSPSCATVHSVTTQADVQDKIWGDVARMQTAAHVELFPGVMDVLREFYVRGVACTLILSNDSVRRGIIRRYDAHSVDITLIETGLTVAVPTGTIVSLDKTT